VKVARTVRRGAVGKVPTRQLASSLPYLDKRAAQFLFQLVSRRYLKGSIILTSNKSYGDWGSIFSDTVLATAILDRLLHTSTTLNIRGQSYRLREKSRAGVFHGLPGTASSAQKES